MFIIIFESTTPIARSKEAVGYYTALQKLLPSQPGFISEVPYPSLHHDDQQVLIAQWEDEKGVHIWRTPHDHLIVQRNVRDHIFDAYRLRVGPEVSTANETDSTPTQERVTKHEGHFIVLYERPVATSSAGEISGDLEDLIDPSKASVSGTSSHLVDVSVYKGESNLLWISAWPDKAAAYSFESSLHRRQDDTVHMVQVVRDYGKLDRSEAPKGANAAQDASVRDGEDVA